LVVRTSRQRWKWRRRTASRNRPFSDTHFLDFLSFPFFSFLCFVCLLCCSLSF
jgi:hypothetical protein